MRKSRNLVEQANSKMVAVTTVKMAANPFTRSKRKAVLTDYDIDNNRGGAEWTTPATADWSYKGSDRNRRVNITILYLFKILKG
jgi:hypothetical protein